MYRQKQTLWFYRTLTFACLLGLTGCQKDVQDTQELEGKRHSILRRHPNRKIARMMLIRSIRYRGLTLKAHQIVRFYDNGQLRAGQLAQVHTVQGVPARSRSLVKFSRTGRLLSAYLARPQTFGRISLPQGSLIRLAENGDLVGFTDATSKQTSLQWRQRKLPCEKHRLILHAPRGYWGCVLRKDTAFGKLRARAGRIVWFDAKQDVRQITLASDYTRQDVHYKAGETLVFTAKGIKRIKRKRAKNAKNPSTRPSTTPSSQATTRPRPIKK